MPELLHAASLVMAEGAKDKDTRNLSAGCMCYTLVQQLLDSVQLPSYANKAQICENFHVAVRAGHAGQGLALAGVGALVDGVVADGDTSQLEAAVLCNYRLQTAVPAACFAKIGALAGEGEPKHVEALGEFFRLTCLGFQLASDVSAIKAGAGSGKEGLGCVTMPVVKALSRIKGRPERAQLYKQVMNGGGGGGKSLLENIEKNGGLQATMAQAISLVEEGWKKIASPAVLPDSYHALHTTGIVRLWELKSVRSELTTRIDHKTRNFRDRSSPLSGALH